MSARLLHPRSSRLAPDQPTTSRRPELLCPSSTAVHLHQLKLLHRRPNLHRLKLLRPDLHRLKLLRCDAPPRRPRPDRSPPPHTAGAAPHPDASRLAFLSRFYPFAGRVVPNASTGVPEVVCGNAGAELVVAHASAALADVDFADADASLGHIQVPFERGLALSLQLVRFVCGPPHARLPRAALPRAGLPRCRPLPRADLPRAELPRAEQPPAPSSLLTSGHEREEAEASGAIGNQ